MKARETPHVLDSAGKPTNYAFNGNLKIPKSILVSIAPSAGVLARPRGSYQPYVIKTDGKDSDQDPAGSMTVMRDPNAVPHLIWVLSVELPPYGGNLISLSDDPHQVACREACYGNI